MARNGDRQSNNTHGNETVVATTPSDLTSVMNEVHQQDLTKAKSNNHLAKTIAGAGPHQEFAFNSQDLEQINHESTVVAHKFKFYNPNVEQYFHSGLTGLASHLKPHADGSIFVSTGDIPDEWLRDSSAQVRPFLYFAKSDNHIAQMIKGVLAQQAKDILADPYANAFKPDGTVWERKFEVDSLTAPVSLSWTYWKQTNDASAFTPSFAKALDTILDTFRTEQDHNSSHYFRKDLGRHDTASGTGMIWTGFRPSDDPCKFNFNIPDEMQAVVALGQIAEIEKKVYHNPDKAKLAAEMQAEVNYGIQKYGIVNSPKYGAIYAYEVDGKGNYLLEDDANTPSLLGAPYSGYLKSSDPIYQNTRRFILSHDNPTFYSGKTISGVGSHHTPKGYVWPLSLEVQAITSNSRTEREELLNELIQSDPGDHRLHESFNPDQPKQFTRKDFSWPNSFFSETLLSTLSDKPPLAKPTIFSPADSLKPVTNSQ